MGRDYAHDPCHIAPLYWAPPSSPGANMKKLLTTLIVAVALVAPQVQAGVIGTDQALQQTSERERVKTMLARPEVAQQAGRLDALPAGGALSNNELIIILLIVVIVLLIL